MIYQYIHIYTISNLIDFTYRKATILINERSYFGVLDKKTYDDISKDADEKYKKNSLNFLASCYIFNYVDLGKLSQYINSFSYEKINTVKKIFMEGESAGEIYFIKKGTFELSKNISLYDLNKILCIYGEFEEGYLNMDMLEIEKRYSKFINYNRIK